MGKSITRATEAGVKTNELHQTFLDKKHSQDNKNKFQSRLGLKNRTYSTLV